MKKIVLIALSVVGLFTNVDAQWAGEPRSKREYKDNEQQDGRAYEFEVNGFARDKDTRNVKQRNEDDYVLNGFDNNAEENAEKRSRKLTRKEKKTLAGRKARAERYKDIEVLMLDLNLAKIQKPVFRGIMEEHKMDVNKIITDVTLIAADKNIALRQMYALRNKRLQETLTDTQYRKWLKVRDDDEFVVIEKPEDY